MGANKASHQLDSAPGGLGDTDDESAVLPVAAKDNNWLGFCPAAIKLQNGDKKVCSLGWRLAT